MEMERTKERRKERKEKKQDARLDLHPQERVGNRKRSCTLTSFPTSEEISQDRGGTLDNQCEAVKMETILNKHSVLQPCTSQPYAGTGMAWELKLWLQKSDLEGEQGLAMQENTGVWGTETTWRDQRLV